MFRAFSTFTRIKTFKHKFLKFWSFNKPSLGSVRSHAKFGPDRFSRFDVYWVQTNKQSNKKQTGKQSIYIFIKNIFRTVYTFWSFSFFPLYSRHFDQFLFPPSDVIYNPFICNFKWPSYRISIYRWSKNSLFFFLPKSAKTFITG